MKSLTIFASIVFIFLFTMPITKTEASYHGPWYACYVESGGQLEKCVGPFKNKYQWK